MNDALLTVNQKILLAGADLEDAGSKPFAANALVVKAWTLYPQTFGLRGFEKAHPCSNAVLVALMGAKGIVRRGYLTKVAPKTYELSRHGLAEVALLRETNGAHKPAAKQRDLKTIRFPSSLETELASLFLSVAHRRHKDGLSRMISYIEARAFLGVTDSAVGAGVDAALATVPKFLDTVDGYMVNGAIDLSTGQTVTQAEVDSLRGTYTLLTATFAGRLAQQRERRVYV